MARKINDRIYYTLAEALAKPSLGVSIPACMASLSVGSALVGSDITLSKAFENRFASRYLSTADVAVWSKWLENAAKITVAFYSAHVARINALLASFVEDGEEERTEVKRPSQGSTDFDSAYSDGGTITKRSGASSGNADRIIKTQDEVKDLFARALDEFEPLFLGVLSEFGQEVEP